jgi:hypothetical protein
MNTRPNKTAALIAVAALASGALTKPSAGVITSATNPANGHLYYLLTNADWTASEAEAVSLGGHLVTINDAAENQWVFNTFGLFGGVQRNLWLGFNDTAVEGTFVWVSGETPGYTNWNTGEPNEDLDGIENWAVITAPQFSLAGVWNDTENQLTGRHNATPGTFYPNHGVVEVIPNPPRLAIALVAASPQLSISNLLSGREYRVMRSSALSGWEVAHSFTATSANYSWSEALSPTGRMFYRLEWNE